MNLAAKPEVIGLARSITQDQAWNHLRLAVEQNTHAPAIGDDPHHYHYRHGFISAIQKVLDTIELIAEGPVLAKKVEFYQDPDLKRRQTKRQEIRDAEAPDTEF